MQTFAQAYHWLSCLSSIVVGIWLLWKIHMYLLQGYFIYIGFWFDIPIIQTCILIEFFFMFRITQFLLFLCFFIITKNFIFCFSWFYREYGANLSWVNLFALKNLLDVLHLQRVIHPMCKTFSARILFLSTYVEAVYTFLVVIGPNSRLNSFPFLRTVVPCMNYAILKEKRSKILVVIYQNG